LLTVFVVPVMYSLFARAKVPGANTATAKEQPEEGHGHHGDPELVAK
jgi:multidrug efflux pump